MALTPLAGGCVAEFWGLPWLFGLSLIFSVVALAWLVVTFKEPRSLSGKVSTGASVILLPETRKPYGTVSGRT